ncbi:hypothetical protein ABMY26_06620 (plasmid) [Azospirillum sp. HJ39]|uniref:hypothetical protein n=1 Tax=Azospirillum sp. HJ39 TaxID=3159496 RepID=UPI0035576BC2
MQTYSDWRPTPVDRAGIDLDDQHDWLVLPTGQNRDSDHTTRSNFQQALKMLGGEGDHVEVHRFGHWSCGWLEVIIVQPDTEEAKKAEEIEKRLANYPLLNEDDISVRESNAYNEAWEEWGARDFIAELVRKFDLSDDEEELLDDNEDNEALQKFFEELNPRGDYQEDGGPIIRRSIEKAKEDDVQDFLDKLRNQPSDTTEQLDLPI